MTIEEILDEAERMAGWRELSKYFGDFRTCDFADGWLEAILFIRAELERERRYEGK